MAEGGYFPLRDITTGEVVCPGCGYHYPEAEVNGVCNKCKALECADPNSEARDVD